MLTTSKKNKPTQVLVLIIACASMLSSYSFAALDNETALNCAINPAQLTATYTIQSTSTHHHKPAKSNTNRTLVLWRHNNVVAHQYPETAITESWQLLKHTSANTQLVKPVRYFDQHERAIEYQPGETLHGKKEKNWHYRQQLVSPSLLQQMTLVKSAGIGCDLQQTYTLTQPHHSITLVWQPALKLLVGYKVSTPHYREEWQLVSVSSEKKTISAFFNQLDHYQTTDYADIGDDHTDPFLTNMVNLGFIEAGASGFYRADGQAISDHRH
ncbi:hypothetical protein [Flocculibacter collagenilyticus]|uniref:hypothetical protein n=1 Tax=Flocculibacter collagenilyticus TaxID=2744479 RepID=UPI001F341FD4|nr:hypothetical protein [Flocculibacter collagenilyticus]